MLRPPDHIRLNFLQQGQKLLLLLPVQTVQDALSQVLLVGEVGVVECDALLREGQAGGGRRSVSRGIRWR